MKIHAKRENLSETGFYFLTNGNQNACKVMHAEHRFASFHLEPQKRKAIRPSRRLFGGQRNLTISFFFFSPLKTDHNGDPPSIIDQDITVE